MKRLLSIVLTLCLLVALFPAPAAANEPDAPALVYRWVMNNGNEYSILDGPAQSALTGAPGRNTLVQFYYLADDTETALSCSSLTVSEGAPFTATPVGDTTFTELRFSDFGSGMVRFTPEGGSELTLTVTVGLPEIGFYSSTTASRNSYLSQWNYNGTNKTVYLINRDATLTSVEAPDQAGISVSKVSDCCYAVTMNALPDNGQVRLVVAGTEHGSAFSGRFFDLRINDVRPALVYRYVRYDSGNYSVETNGSAQTALTGSPERSNYFQFYYRYSDGSGLHETPVSCSSLTVSEGAPFTAAPVGGTTFTELRFSDFGSGMVRFTPEGGSELTLPVTVGLPDVGFYSSDQTFDETTYLREWRYDGTNDTIYLHSRIGAFTSITDNNNSGAVIYQTGSDVAAVTLSSVDNLNSLYLRAQGDTTGGGKFNWGVSIPIIDTRPALVCRWVNEEPGGTYSVNMNGNAQTAVDGAPGNMARLQFYYRVSTTETALPPAALSFTETVNGVRLFTASAVQGTDYVRLDFAAFGSGGEVCYAVGSDTLTLPVTVGLPDVGFYSSDQIFDENTYLREWRYDGTNDTVYLHSRVGNFISITDNNESGARIDYRTDSDVAAVTLDSVGNLNGLSLSVRCTMNNGYNFGTGVWLQINRPGSGNAESLDGFELFRESDNAETIPLFTGKVYDDIHPVRVAFTDDSNETVSVYVGIRFYVNGGTDPVMAKGMHFLPGETSVRKFSVGFWIGEENDGVMSYWPIDEDQYPTLLAHFSDLELSLQRTASCNGRSPEFYRLVSGDKSVMALKFNYDTVGQWIPVLTGKADGVAFTSYGNFDCNQYNVNPNNIWEPTYSITLDAVSEFFANAYQNRNPEDNYFKVTLPYDPDGYYGTIIIPNSPVHGCTFNVVASSSCPLGTRQLIRGNVVAGGTTYLKSLAFESPGEKTDSTNVCGSGSAEIRATDCSFTGYYRAMECDGAQNWKLGFEQCEFIDNATAIYLRATDMVNGSCVTQNCLFKNNDIALELAQFSPLVALHIYKTVFCRFIDNGYDVKNTSGHIYFMPKNYFEHGGQVTEAKCPNGTSQVSCFPNAKTYDLSQYDYSNPSPFLSKNGNILIPLNALAGKMITIVQQGNGNQADANLLFWRFPNSTPNP